MKLKDRIKALSDLGAEVHEGADWLKDSISVAYNQNQWFTPENSWKALIAIRDQFLDRKILEDWTSDYNIREEVKAKKVGLVLAGNIPLVGFHDILSTFISGHKSLIKLSSKDPVLLKSILGKMMELYPETSSYFEFSERLVDFDAVIATGSNNSSKYFEQYFGKYPNIIRKNRSAVAVIDGTESEQDFIALGEDIFNYFGLGCRNVSKLYVPENYDFDHLLTVLHNEYKEIANHNKYRNNFDYNNALFLLNKVAFLMSGSLILTASKDITSRIATLHFEAYADREVLTNHLKIVRNQIQCVVSKEPVPGIKTFRFGDAQKPSISDYADGVDTIEFLKSL